jgi:hypothetical protein
MSPRRPSEHHGLRILRAELGLRLLLQVAVSGELTY